MDLFVLARDRSGVVVIAVEGWKFKGLERMVVGVGELDGAPDRALYVGFSRPSVFLSVFAPEGTLRRLRIAAQTS
jgi:hypothetical protein